MYMTALKAKAKYTKDQTIGFVRRNWKGILGGAIGIAAIVWSLSSNYSEEDENAYDKDDEYDFGNNYTGDDEPIDDSTTAIPYQPRYTVEFKAFKTGEWYTKTKTDSVAAAHSVAQVGNWGRACRLTDTKTGDVLFESDEKEGMAETNGYI